MRQGDAFILSTIFIFLIFEVLQGPLRYYLSMMGGVVLAYAPKGLMALAFFFLLIRTLWTFRLDKTVMGTLAGFAVFAAVGVYFTHGIGQPVMGLFALIPVLFGVIAEPAFSRLGERCLPYALVLWLCVAVGVGINFFHSMPWTGFTYQLGDAEVEVSRDWSYFGVERIAGFARASFEAAMQLLFLGLVCSILVRSKVIAFIVWISTGILIAVTTTKTTLGLYFFLAILLPLMAPRAAPSIFKRVIGPMVPWTMALIGVLLPASTLVSKVGAGFANQDSGTLLVSFGMRLAQMWPDTFTLIFKHGSALLGRGLGGIGSAQKIFEPDLYSPADNLYLYLYAVFGVFALVVIWVFTRAVSRLKFTGDRMSTLFWFLGVSILMEGWTVSCIEGGTTALATGLTVAFCIRLGKSRFVRRSMGTSRHKLVGAPQA
ncbi:hypothetical protein Y882_12370 [Dyella japonica DSM 16301]|uniref:Polysaccharide polymerase n=1 Tax=Dyella japonica DSM 16301 TaxID=1440762 RepID=A0A0G9H075_9GAMM|nr:hypothetical protein Y882_12370 [Dyella japonica DSM 16301]